MTTDQRPTSRSAHEGGIRVTSERWEEAQRWERSVWRRARFGAGIAQLAEPIVRPLLSAVRRGHSFGDDWNHWWAKRFDGYAFLPSKIENFIELGCGPYTNTRLVLRGRTATHAYCSDPLIRDYADFVGTWLWRAHRRREVLLDDHPAEECPFRSDYFDVVVIINVLDHVRDAALCLQEAVRITKQGGYLLLGQDLSNDEDAAATAGDVGHPVTLDRGDVDPFLAGFDPVINTQLSRDEGRNPSAHYGTLVFAGRKR
jgi:SAM-dependent methyltransferase